MSLINQMLRDLQAHGNDSSIPGRRFSGIAKRKAAIIRQFVAGCLGLIFLGAIWLAGDLIVGGRSANQQMAGADRDAHKGQAAPADVTAKKSVVNRDAGYKVQSLPGVAPLAPATASGVTSPENEVAETSANPASSTGARYTPSAEMNAVTHLPAPELRVVAQYSQREVSPTLSAASAGHLMQTPPDALTEEEATLIPNASAEQAYQAGKRALLGGSDNELAVRYLRQALALNTGHLLARDLLAEVYHKVNRNDAAAMELLREGMDLAPGYTGFTKKYARILADRGDHAAAVKGLLHGGLPAIKRDAESLEFLATLYTRLDEPYLAAQTYRNLIANWPRNGNYWVGLGTVLEKQGQAGEAVTCYRKALDTSNLRREAKDQATRRLAALTQTPPG